MSVDALSSSRFFSQMHEGHVMRQDLDLHETAAAEYSPGAGKHTIFTVSAHIDNNSLLEFDDLQSIFGEGFLSHKGGSPHHRGYVRFGVPRELRV